MPCATDTAGAAVRASTPPPPRVMTEPASGLTGPIEAALANPWTTLQWLTDEPLHPGGVEATVDLLDRAEVTEGTRVLDVGCGAGSSLSLANDRGAEAIGIDLDPQHPGRIRSELERMPIRPSSVDVVLSECVLCLAADRDRAIAEIDRVLRSGGRLALSDVVVEGTLPTLPEELLRALCLEEGASRSETVGSLERHGFVVEDVRDHREDLLAMRDQLETRIDYRSLLGVLGARGEHLLDGIEKLERAVESGAVGYVSIVASRE